MVHSTQTAATGIRFYRRGAWHTLDGITPTRTVLQYLREDCGHTGTKEGCAEGDCGACTVIVSDVCAGAPRHQAVNACIALVPGLHGKALTTVEDLADANGALHPVQQAMVDCHASQCGFCTPGFVMALYSLYQQHAGKAAPGRQQINDALAGNLCRCTGYRPIVDAAVQMFAQRESAEHVARRSNTIKALQGNVVKSAAVLDSSAGRWFAPRTLTELLRCVAHHPDARIVAGTTDVGLWITKQLRTFDKLVSVTEVAELRQVRVSRNALSIGAAVTWSEALPHLVQHFPAMEELLRRFASPLIRNSATVGGNLANGSPIGDSMPAFIALGAQVELARWDLQHGVMEKRSMPLEDFYLAYQKTALRTSEVVTGVRVPILAADTHFRTYKISKRFDQDISAVAAGIAWRMQQGRITSARIAFGGMAATPKRAMGCEASLVGQVLNQATITRAQAALEADFAPLSDMRASADYRRVVARNLLQRAFLEATGVSATSLHASVHA